MIQMANKEKLKNGTVKTDPYARIPEVLPEAEDQRRCRREEDLGLRPRPHHLQLGNADRENPVKAQK